MNVILLEKIGKLGSVGDQAVVKAGYARNYLFPKGMAIPATTANLADFESRRAELLAAHNEKVAAAQGRADKLRDVRVSIAVNAGEEGRLFGSVGTSDIADAVNATVTDVELVKAEVRLPEGPIRTTGEFEIVIDLDYDVEAVVTVEVVAA